jgi:hypothetical protein
VFAEHTGGDVVQLRSGDPLADCLTHRLERLRYDVSGTSQTFHVLFGID